MVASGKILELFGIEGIINAYGPYTMVGGSVIDDEVLAAMREASKVYIDMSVLHVKVGEFIAKLTGAEDAYVSNGAAAGLCLSIAACMTKGQFEKMIALPRTDDFPNEVIMQKLHRNSYDNAARIPGGRIMDIGDERGTKASDLENAIGPKTSSVLYFYFDPTPGILPLDDVVRISHQRGVPVVVDAASDLPPPENIRQIVQKGVDIVVFSGGKDINGPNDTGLVLGKKDYIGICRRLGPHNYEKVNSKTYSFLGRPMKTSKEDIVGVAVALRKYLTETDHVARMARWERMAQYMENALSKTGYPVRSVVPKFPHPRPISIPRVEIDARAGRLNSETIVKELQSSKPQIKAYEIDGRVYLNPQCLQDGEEKIVVSRLLAML